MVETAVVLLVLVPLLLGLAELSEALTLKRRVETAAVTAADLVTRATEVSKPVTKAELGQVRELLDRIVKKDQSGDKDSLIIGSYTCKFKGKGVEKIPEDVRAKMDVGNEIVLVQTQSEFTSRLARLIPNAITLHGISYFAPRTENDIELKKNATC